MDWFVSSRGEIWLYFGYILKVELLLFVDGLDEGSEREELRRLLFWFERIGGWVWCLRLWVVMVEEWVEELK